MLYPLMLLGLLGLSVPIIIHLIQRQRLKPQMLATLRFLDQLDVANAFAPVPRDLLQLLLRLLLLLVFVLLMARLALSGHEPGPRTLAVILDQSMSMQQRCEGGTLFEHHKRSILNLIDGLRPQDRMALLLVSDRVAAETPYLSDRAQLRRAAEGFQVSDGGALALVPTIQQTVNRLRSRREVNAAVLVFSDQQRLNYAPYLTEADRSRSSQSARFTRALDHGNVRLFLISDGPAPSDNVAVVRAQFSPERVYLGASARLTAEISNLTGKEKTTRVFLFEGSQAGENRSLMLTTGETARIDLVHRFESPVDTACRVELEDDALPGDNRFNLPMRMRDRKQVLLVARPGEENKEETGEIRYDGANLLAYALNPGETLGQGAGTYIQVRKITPEVLGRLSLPLYSVVILYGLAELPAQSVKDLTAFVENGGGLYLVPDDAVPPRTFNETFAPLLQGFMLGQSREPDAAVGLDHNEAQLASPLLAPLVRGEWTDVRDVFFHRYFTVAAPGSVGVLLRAANGDPLGILHRQGRGRVLVQLFSCDLSAGSLPRTTGFVPMVQQIVSSLSVPEDDPGPDLMRVGDTARLRVPEYRGLGQAVRVAGPEDRAFALTGPDKDEIQVEGLTRAGAYELSHPLKKTGRKRWLAVNPVEGESDLTPLSDTERAALFGKRNALLVPYAKVGEHFSRRHEILGFMIALLLAAFLIETLLGAWQSRRTRRTDEGAPAAGGTA